MSFGSIHYKQIIFKANNKSTKKKCKDLPKVNQNIRTTWQTLWYPCCQTDICVCRVDVLLLFKNARRRKKVYNKCKSEKIPKADSAPLNRSENGCSCQNC